MSMKWFRFYLLLISMWKGAVGYFGSFLLNILLFLFAYFSYSSEAESKLGARRTSERHQREFVKTLNKRIQESARDYVKYRFPPEIVDVK